MPRELQTYERTLTIRLEVYDKSLNIAEWVRETLKEEPWVSNVAAVSSSRPKAVSV